MCIVRIQVFQTKWGLCPDDHQLSNLFKKEVTSRLQKAGLMVTPKSELDRSIVAFGQG